VIGAADEDKRLGKPSHGVAVDRILVHCELP
jgi:hypothetical protein